MIPNIAVICAAHRGNSGMFSVDSSAVAYFSKRECNYDLFFAQNKKGNKLMIGDKEAKILEDQKQLSKYTHIVYWGDFLNNPIYGRGDFSRRDVDFKHSDDLSGAYERWEQLFCLKDFEGSPTVVSVGNNFQHDFTKSKGEFSSAFKNLEKRFSRILPRDPFSCQNISRMISFDRQQIVRQGMDCAFLLPSAKEARKANIFSYSFNRSKIENTDSIIDAIERETGLKGINIEGWLRLPQNNAPEVFESYRGIIASSKFVVSDTYHFLINSINLNIPAIAISRKARRQTGTLGDFKKKVLFQMLGLESQHLEFNDPNRNERFSDVVVESVKSTIALFNPKSRYSIAKNLAEKFESDIDQAVFGTRYEQLRLKN